MDSPTADSIQLLSNGLTNDKYVAPRHPQFSLEGEERIDENGL
jgi:hypothetical protein